ncbi:MAG: TerB family tellurite resistance protein [SAR324 cluster bacterium]|nr:TerB family tellurite resistance protein [SAR324 cluster bacterium]
MNKSTYKMLTPEQQFWYANVMIDMILADGVIHPSEQKYLGIIFKSFAENPKQLDHLREKSLRSEPEKILPIEGISNELAILILEDCTDAAIADAEFHEKEQKLIHEIGHQLQLNPKDIESIILKGKQQLGHIFAFAS